MPKIKIDTKIKDLKGKPLVENGSGVETTAGDMILGILQQPIPVRGSKEAFFVTDIGLAIINAKNGEVDIQGEKYAFLKRIIDNNKVRVDFSGKESDFFAAFIWVQLMQLFK